MFPKFFSLAGLRDRSRFLLPVTSSNSASSWLLGLAFAADFATAAPVVTTDLSGPNAPSTTTDEVTYAADVSNSDLLHGIAGTGGNWHGSGSSPTGLNDGNPGGDFDDVGNPAALNGTAWAQDGGGVSFREFELGIGEGGRGYDITRIQSIAAWQGAGFSNQKYEVRVRLVGEAGFPASPLLTVDYQPFPVAPNNNGGSTKVNVTDDTGVLAIGVEAIRFDILDTTSNDGGGAVIREIDVFGVPTGPDETAPTIHTLSPLDDATGVLPGRNLVATFSEHIVLGTGNITFKNLDASSQTVIPVGDSRVSVSGAVLTINPASDLAANTNYAIRIDASAVDDLSGNSFAGVENDTIWNFTTGLPDLIAPKIVSASPPDDSGDVPVASDLMATFDEEIVLGSGNIVIKDLDTLSQTVLTLPDSRVSVAGAVLTIDPVSSFAATTNYAIRIDATAVTDLSGNPFTGIADDTTWNFTTATEPLRIMCLGDSITVGYTDNPSWANHPFMFGYRSGLYTRLTDAGYNFLFVGASTEPWTGISGDPTHGGTYTPALDLRDFGQDGHRGYGGAGIWSNVNGWIAADDPDVILLLIGINGIGAGSPAKLNTLVNSIVTAAPDVHLIVAQITPRATFNRDLYDYNVYIRDTLVPAYAGNGHKVTTVDLYSLFLTDPNDYRSAIKPGVLSNNINHPDNPHYELMAQKWFEGIEALGLGPDNFTSWIADPAFGLDPADQGFGDDPDRDWLTNGIEAWFGTHPGQFTTGLTDFVTVGSTTTFSHPQNGSPPGDLAGFYEWSPNLTDWYASGNGPSGGATVTFSPLTENGMTTVTAAASEALERLFLRVGVMRN